MVSRVVGDSIFWGKTEDFLEEPHDAGGDSGHTEFLNPSKRFDRFFGSDALF